MRRIDLGHLDYRQSWQQQEATHAEVAAGGEEAILHVEHPPVITLGRRAEVGRSHILATPAELRRLHVDVVETDRGGDATYHGPGQLVAYPVVRLVDHRLSVGGYMCLLQKAVIETLARFRLPARLEPKAPGVWCDPPHATEPAKICAVGVRVKKGVTLHGLALNVDPDMHQFELIDPCGLGRPVTSMRRMLGERCPSILAVRAVLHRELCRRLGGGPDCDDAGPRDAAAAQAR